MSTLSSVIELGIFASMGAAGIPGRLFFTTDTLQIYRDNGVTWDNVTPNGAGTNLASGETVAGSGTAFTLAHSPSPALSLQLVQRLPGFGGVVLIPPTDFTLAGAAITTVNSLSAGVLTAWYRF